MAVQPERRRFAPEPWPEWACGDSPAAGDCRRAFDRTEPYTIGVEEELMLIDPATLELAPRVERALELAGGDPRFAQELRAAQIEIVTPVCRSAAEAHTVLADARHDLALALDGELLFAAAGTHPFATGWGEITADPRYRDLADEYGWAARRSLMCGLHVHVAVGDAGRALAVFNAVRSFAPELAALAANAPFLEGRDTGLASVRPKLNEGFPRSGVPPALSSWESFADLLRWGLTSGAFPDASYLWWEIRPAPAYGTIELRVPDAQTSVADAAAVVAVAQCLVAWLGERHDAGEELPVHDATRIAENDWRAFRFGLDGWLADLDTGEARPTRERVAELIGLLEPVGERLGCVEQLLRARTLVVGNGAERQRYVAEREGLDGLVRRLVAETA